MYHKLYFAAQVIGEAPTVVAPTFIGMNSSDNTQWYDCEVCNKRLNTANQLALHKQSPKHKKQEERMHEQINQNEADQTVWKICHVCNKKVKLYNYYDNGY